MRFHRTFLHGIDSLPTMLPVEIHTDRQMGRCRHDTFATAAALTHHSTLGPTLSQGFEAPTCHEHWPDLPNAPSTFWPALNRPPAPD